MRRICLLLAVTLAAPVFAFDPVEFFRLDGGLLALELRGPDSRLTDFRRVQTRADGTPAVEVTAKVVERFQRSARKRGLLARAEQPRLLLSPANGRMFTLTGDLAEIELSGTLILKGNVALTASDAGKLIETQSLRYFPRIQKLTSPHAVTLLAADTQFKTQGLVIELATKQIRLVDRVEIVRKQPPLTLTAKSMQVRLDDTSALAQALEVFTRAYATLLENPAARSARPH